MGHEVGGGGGGEEGKQFVARNKRGTVRGIESVVGRNVRMENCGDKQCWRKEENVRKNNKRIYCTCT